MGSTPIFIVAYALLALALICFALQFVLSKKGISGKTLMYLSIGGISLSLISAVIMIFGQNAIEAGEKYVNFSYGFFLMVAFALIAASLSLMPFFAKTHFDKVKKEEALETLAE
jgi:drug/metabolite transporter (DMT)-like permease